MAGLAQAAYVGISISASLCQRDDMVGYGGYRDEAAISTVTTQWLMP